MQTVKQCLAGLKRAAMRRPPLGHASALVGGPYHGQLLRLAKGAGKNTLVFTANGKTGRHVDGRWNPVVL